jgi:hypothetical protein
MRLLLVKSWQADQSSDGLAFLLLLFALLFACGDGADECLLAGRQVYFSAAALLLET